MLPLLLCGRTRSDRRQPSTERDVDSREEKRDRGARDPCDGGLERVYTSRRRRDRDEHEDTVEAANQDGRSERAKAR